MADTSGTEASSDEDELREARQAVREHNRKKKKSGGFQSMGRRSSKHRIAENNSIYSAEYTVPCIRILSQPAFNSHAVLQVAVL